MTLVSFSSPRCASPYREDEGVSQALTPGKIICDSNTSSESRLLIQNSVVPTDRRRIIFAILFTVTLVQSMILMVVSFMPLYVAKHYSEIPTSLIGLIVR